MILSLSATTDFRAYNAPRQPSSSSAVVCPSVLMFGFDVAFWSGPAAISNLSDPVSQSSPYSSEPISHSSPYLTEPISQSSPNSSEVVSYSGIDLLESILQSISGWPVNSSDLTTAPLYSAVLSSHSAPMSSSSSKSSPLTPATRQ